MYSGEYHLIDYQLKAQVELRLSEGRIMTAFVVNERVKQAFEY
ncbi:MAG: hypothetical protein ACJAXH_002582 [Colwellia sp.]|jgi:hypothetical protein